MNGGYDDGYERCECFWGDVPGSLISMHERSFGTFVGKKVLDVGAGEGKNSVWFADRGASVISIELSKKAIENGIRMFGKRKEIEYVNSSILDFNLKGQKFHIVILYGLLHCLKAAEIESLVPELKDVTLVNGVHIVCSFNGRLRGHNLAHPGFNPTYFEHTAYLDFYADWNILYQSDQDLTEKHPHNGILHSHSMTRLVATKRGS